MSLEFKKELAGVEDFIFGFNTVEQSRGTITAFNSSHLPFSDTESVLQALEARLTQLESDAKYALINGLDTEQFFVQDSSLPEHAINRQQVLDFNDLKADKSKVILKGDTLAYIPLSDNDPANKSFVESVLSDLRDNTLLKDNTAFYNPIGTYNPATKKYVDDTVAPLIAGLAFTGSFTTNDGQTITFTDGVITGVA